MRKILILLLLGSFATSAFSQSEHTYTPSASNLQAREWFQDARFGMFIHWVPPVYWCELHKTATSCCSFTLGSFFDKDYQRINKF